MVRPERLRLSDAVSSDGTSVPVTLAHAVFQGPVVRCSLRAADGTEIVAHVGPEQTLPALAPGLRLWASWDFEAARLLPLGDAVEPGIEPDMRQTYERAVPRPDSLPRHLDEEPSR